MWVYRPYRNHAGEIIRYDVGYYDPRSPIDFVTIESFWSRTDDNAEQKARDSVHYLNGGNPHGR